MKNHIYRLMILFFTISTLVSCRSSYEEKDGAIYYNWIHGGNLTRESTLVEGADISSFETIQHNSNLELGKDKNHVFYKSQILNGVDPSTFVHVAHYFWKDKNRVYCLKHGIKNNYILKLADPKSFKVFDTDWSRDKSSIYYKALKSEVVDLDSFTPINKDWGKDDKYYYWKTKKLDDLDYESAEIVKTYYRDKEGKLSNYIKDKNHVYFQNQIVKEASPKKFVANGVGTFGNDGVKKFKMEKKNGLVSAEFREKYYVMD